MLLGKYLMFRYIILQHWSAYASKNQTFMGVIVYQLARRTLPDQQGSRASLLKSTLPLFHKTILNQFYKSDGKLCGYERSKWYSTSYGALPFLNSSMLVHDEG